MLQFTQSVMVRRLSIKLIRFQGKYYHWKDFPKMSVAKHVHAKKEEKFQILCTVNVRFWIILNRNTFSWADKLQESNHQVSNNAAKFSILLQVQMKWSLILSTIRPNIETWILARQQNGVGQEWNPRNSRILDNTILYEKVCCSFSICPHFFNPETAKEDA